MVLKIGGCAFILICLLAGCSGGTATEEPGKQQVVDEEVQEVEEPVIKKEQYDVVWGTYDNEWVYSDEWTGEGFKDFDEAMRVLNHCMQESEEDTERCVHDYLMNNSN